MKVSVEEQVKPLNVIEMRPEEGCPGAGWEEDWEGQLQIAKDCLAAGVKPDAMEAKLTEALWSDIPCELHSPPVFAARA